MAYKNIMFIEMYSENENNPQKHYVASLHLPANKHRIANALEQCRAYRKDTVIAPFKIESCGAVPNLEGLDLGFPTIDELNFLALRFSEMSPAEMAAYNALLPVIIKDEGEENSIKDIINLTYCTGDCVVASNVSTDEALGELMIESDNISGIEKMPEETIALLDRARIGKQTREAGNGIFCNGFYIERAGFKIDKEIYDGKTLPEHTIEDYIFRIDIIGDDDSKTPITFPLSAEMRKMLGSVSSFFRYDNFESSIGLIEDLLHNNSIISKKIIDDLDKLAQALASDRDMMTTIYIKATLEAKGITSLDDFDEIEQIINNPFAYKLYDTNMFQDDFAKDILARYLKEGFPRDYLNAVQTTQLGYRMTEDFDCKYTSYGVIVNKEKMAQALGETERQYQVAKVADQTVLFTNERIRSDDVPKGLRKYEVRSGDGIEYAALEQRVAVDFAGTVLAKAAFDMGKEGFINLLEHSENGIDFYDGQLTPTEYLTDGEGEAPEISNDEGMAMHL